MKQIHFGLILLLLCTMSFSQTKTEDAKKKLDSQDEETTEAETGDNENGFDNFCSEIFFDLFMEIAGQLAFNYSFAEHQNLQPVYYIQYPYVTGESSGIRTHLPGSNTSFQAGISTGYNYEDELSNFSAGADYHFNGWAVRARIKYLKESGAPYGIYYGLLKIERKAVAFSFLDMGSSMGLGNLRMEGDNYPGFIMGFNLEVFPVKPVSIVFRPGVLFPFDSPSQITDTIIGLNFHFNESYIGIHQNYFSISDIEFTSTNVKFGYYFQQ